MEISNLLTFIMPVRIDSKERMRNIFAMLSWFSPLGCKTIILEASSYRLIQESKLEKYKNVEYVFFKDENPVFHRTRYINILLKKATTKVVAIWDADIITQHLQVEEAVNNIVANGCTLAYPYSGEYVLLSEKDSDEFVASNDIDRIESKKLKPLYARPFCGGAYFVNKSLYLTIGGENEFFIGWGPEDVERLKRVEIMGHKVKRAVIGVAYHLFHPRNENSNFYDITTACITRTELIKVCSMNKDELKEYINTWKEG